MRILALALSFLISAPEATYEPIHPETIARVKQSVVRVESADSICTGFVIGIARAITAEHCVGDELAVEQWPARVIKTKGNLVLLETEVFNKPNLKVAPESPEIGTPVAAFGYAFGLGLLVYQRSVAAYAVDNGIYLDGVISAGMSGGPVVNSRGEVVGVNEATNIHVGYLTNGQDLRKLLKK